MAMTVSQNNTTPACNASMYRDAIKTWEYVAATVSKAQGRPQHQVMMEVLFAVELGIPVMQAVTGGIRSIGKNIEMCARMLTAQIRKRGHSFTVKRSDNEACIVEGTRCDNGDTMIASFTIEDAKQAGLLVLTSGSRGKSAWEGYTQDMLFCRAVSRLGRRLFSDCIGTAYVEGEIERSRERAEPVASLTKAADSAQERTHEDSKPAYHRVSINSLGECVALTDFLSTCTDDKKKMMEAFISKYSEYYKKSYVEALQDCQENPDKFISYFNKWSDKELKQVKQASSESASVEE